MARTLHALRARRLAACLLAAALSCTLLSGCKDSSKLVELIFDQNAQTVIDYDDPLLQNIRESADLTDLLPELDQSDQSLNNELQDYVVQQPGQDDVADTAPAPQVEYSPTAPMDATPAASPEGDASDAQGAGAGSGQEGSPSPQTGQDESGGEQRGEGGQASGQGQGEGEHYVGGNGTGAVYDADGMWAQLPEQVQTAVAFGEVANMVVSFAGQGALLGSDEGFLASPFIQQAYAARGIADVAQVAYGSGSDAAVDVDAIIALAPDAVLVANNYLTLPDEAAQALSDAHIDLVRLPAMDSAAGVIDTASFIGQMFGGDAASRAQAYIDWHNAQVAALSDAHGGLAGTVNFSNGTAEGTSGGGTYTVYVSDWDGATYTASPGGGVVWTDDGGVAIAQAGWRWSPLSYYLQVGGSINNAANFKYQFYDITNSYYVWQFNLGVVPAVYAQNWQGLSVPVAELDNDGTPDLLVLGGGDRSIRLGGSDGRFPYVICKNAQIAQRMQASRDAATLRQYGLYAVYANGGFSAADGSFADAYIGGTFDVQVNPCGLYSNWIEGSPESVLEAVWAADLNDGTSNLPGALSDFYRLFYDVELSQEQIDTIMAGEQ